MKAPIKPLWYNAQAQVGGKTLNATVAQTRDVILHPFERTILHPDDSEAFAFRNVFINFATSNRVLNTRSF